jgi:hypothetical protein
MTVTHLVLRYLHISMGMLALLSGAGAMTLRKGSRLHRRSGNVFFVSMLTMATAGVVISIFITPVMANVMGGTMAFYMTATAWATVWRKPGQTGLLEIGLALLGLAAAIAGVTFAGIAANSPTGKLHGSSATFYVVFASAALLGVALDARMIARGGFTGVARTTRHLCRMCIAMFIATGSFFLGQAKLFPAEVRASGVLKIPVLLVIGAFLYWVIRVQVWPRLRRVSTRVWVRAHS